MFYANVAVWKSSFATTAICPLSYFLRSDLMKADEALVLPETFYHLEGSNTRIDLDSSPNTTDNQPFRRVYATVSLNSQIKTYDQATGLVNCDLSVIGT